MSSSATLSAYERNRSELRPAIIDQLHQAATAALKAGEKADA